MGALGRKVIEVHAAKAGKGSALAALIPNEDPGGVICFGDDENDRPMFDYVSRLDIPHTCIGVWSPEAPPNLFEGCDLVVPGPESVTVVLGEIVEWAKESS
jgi:hydroxymethylpyrimidine pyrophosphatase-like HAD family hydrolase